MIDPISIAGPNGSARKIGGGAPCFVIAEIGTNWHNGDSNDDSLAKELIDVASDAGCDAVKFQTYRIGEVYVPNPGMSGYLSEAGIRKDINDLIAERVMPHDMLARIANYAVERNVTFMSSCFSLDDLALIDPLTPIHKLASYEISHVRLIDAIAATGKPLIMSTGAAAPDDIAWAVDRFRGRGGDGLVVLQCTAKYPAPDGAMNLRVMNWIEETFQVPTGLSDHSPHPFHAPFAATALGASVIEKHITMDRRAEGPDHFNSVEPGELADMVTGIRAIEAMLGDGEKLVGDAEGELHAFARRCVQAIQPIATGDVFREGVNMAILRPGNRRAGCHPKHIDDIEGRRARGAIDLGDGITPEDAE